MRLIASVLAAGAAGLLLSIGALASPSALAATWEGPATLGVEIKDRGGNAVAGAVVRIRLESAVPSGADGPGGPPPVGTDAAGTAAFGGLAEGEWFVEVAHPDFMSFTAYVVLRAGKAPKTGFTAQVTTPHSSAGMRVVFRKPRSVPPRAAVAEAPAPAAAPAPSAPPVSPTPATAPAAPRAPATPRPSPAPAPPSSAPTAAQPATSASPAPVPPAAPRTPEQTRPTPATVPAAPAAPVPPAPPSPAAAPMPAAPPSVPGSSAGAPLLAVRTADRGNCPECRPGESAVTIEAHAAMAGGDCEAGLAAARAAANALQATPGPSSGFGTHAGPVGGPCQVLAILLPRHARYLGYRYEAEDNRQGGDCSVDVDCTIGEARWRGHPTLQRGAGGTLVLAVFENRSTQALRTARLTAYFRTQAATP